MAEAPFQRSRVLNDPSCFQGETTTRVADTERPRLDASGENAPVGRTFYDFAIKTASVLAGLLGLEAVD